MDSEQLEKMLNRYVRSYLNANGLSSNNLDDFLNRARLAALYAIKNYQADKGMKLKNYIFKCVQSRLSDLDDTLRSHCWGRTELTEDGEIDIVSSVNHFARFEHDFDMRSMLNEREYTVYKKLFIEGYTKLELSEVMSRREIDQCYMRITSSYNAIVKNRRQASTLKKRASVSVISSTSWLSVSSLNPG